MDARAKGIAVVGGRVASVISALRPADDCARDGCLRRDRNPLEKKESWQWTPPGIAPVWDVPETSDASTWLHAR